VGLGGMTEALRKKVSNFWISIHLTQYRGMKKPWEMTEDEWNKAVEATQINFSGCGGTKSDAQKIEALKHRRWLRMDLPDRDVGDGLMAPACYQNVIEHARVMGLI
jgi:hypothetical protein